MHPILDDAGSIPIDTAQLIAHTLVQANSGGGKTVACRRILEQTFGAMPQWVIDPEGEMHTLRERYPHLLAAPRGGDTVASVKTAPLLARRLLETGASCVIDIYDLGVDERHAFVRALAEAAMNQPRSLWRDVLVVIDEAHRYCPERGEDPSEAAGAVKNWLTAGRKRGYAMILAVQRLSTLHKSAAAECNNRLIGRTGLDTDQDRAGKALGLRRPEDREALARLKPGRFWVYGPAFCERPTEVQIGEIHTSHGKSARGKAATPPLEEARKYLAQIGDLPAEAEAELKTVEQLKARVRELETRAPAYDQDELVNKLTKALGERDTADKAVGRLQARLLEMSPIIHEHAQKLVQMHDDLLGRLSGLKVDAIQARRAEAKVTVVDRPWVLSTPDEIIGDIAKATDQAPRLARRPAPPERDRPGLKEARAAIRDQLPERRPAPATNGLPSMQRAFLTVLAQRGQMTRKRLLSFADYKRSGATDKAIGALVEQGLATIPAPGELDITPAGRSALGHYEPLSLRVSQPMQRAVLTVLAQRGRTSRRQVLVFAQYQRSGATDKAMSELISRGWATMPTKGDLEITPDGFEALGEYEKLPTGAALRAKLLAELPKMESAFLRVALKNGTHPVARPTVLEEANYKRSGATDKAFAHLIAMGYLIKSGGAVCAAEEMCEP